MLDLPRFQNSTQGKTYRERSSFFQPFYTCFKSCPLPVKYYWFTFKYNNRHYHAFLLNITLCRELPWGHEIIPSRSFLM